MLMPKKVKFRKQQRGRMRGKAWRGSEVSFGDFGLKAMEPCWLTSRQIEAARIAMTRFIKRGGANPKAAFKKGGRKDLDRVFPRKADHQEAAGNPHGQGQGCAGGMGGG